MAPIPLRHKSRNLQAHRDPHGVPHVQAGSLPDALYALGYLHALDRPTQLLFGRAVAAGRGAELIADRPELFETDCFFRRMGLHLDLDRELGRLERSERTLIEGYCQGVNDGLAESGRTLPMWATGFRPEPWDAAAVMLVGRLLAFGGLVIGQLQSERLLMELIHAGVPDGALRELFSPRLDAADFDLLRRVQMSNQLSQRALELITDLPRLAGSNAWAVSPARSATGFALLASDPHLEVNRLPGIWYEASVRWPTGYLIGATLPGCPLFAVARNRSLAWGVTYMKGDTVDYFIEDCRRGGSTGWQYRRANGWHDFRLRHEPVLRKGLGPTELAVYENDVGTLEDDPSRHGAGMLLSVAWTGRSGGAAESMAAWLRLAQAPDVRHAMDVIRECAEPTLSFVLADRHGHIGLQGCGQFPVRRRPDDGLFPLPAWEEQNHWRGRLDPRWLPTAYDPPQGYVATANEAWNPPSGPLLVTQILPGYRKRRIDQVLQRMNIATLQDMQHLQYDVLSTQAEELLGRWLPLIPNPLRDRLARWDRRYSIDSREATLFHRFYIQLIVEVFGHEGSIGWKRILYLCTRAGYSMMVLQAADRLLMREDPSWIHHHDRQTIARRAAERVMGEQEQTWGEFNQFQFVDRFLGGRSVRRLLGIDSGRCAMPGCHATPFQGHVFRTAVREQTFAPSYHFVTDLGQDLVWTNLPGGPSESQFSPYYQSDLPLWKTGKYKRLAPE
ncbi:MAG: penicillin acylase family protein [Pirellulales bacterium]